MSLMNTKMNVPTSILSPMAGRIPKPLQRRVPFGLAIVVIILFFYIGSSYDQSAEVLKRVGHTVLSYQTPSKAAGDRFPKKIWQSWKVDPLDFEDRDRGRARSWPTKNLGYRYEVLTDGNDLHYVKTNFGPHGLNRPDIVKAYTELEAKIIKADLLRYLVMYVEGGVYADIDVEALRPVDDWIPPSFNASDVGLVISIEIDEPSWSNHTILGPKSQSFCQWTFMSQPRLPVMLRLIDHVIHWIEDMTKKQQVPIGNLTLNFDEVLTGTGPSAFTNVMFAEMEAQTGSIPPWSYFHNMTDPKLVGNILVLQVDSFAAGQGHSNSGNHDSPRALVRHHYHASLWPSRHPRYSHPAYGMVEECNWKPECVHEWDHNTEIYPSLPEEEKQNLIKIKEHADAEKLAKEEEEKAADQKRIDDEELERLQKICATVPPAPQPPAPTEAPPPPADASPVAAPNKEPLKKEKKKEKKP
ncbi:putative initiation-specific alpha-1,6-mannosyltransferase [Calycina marina]|uniref:Initiation-specific alpha-1,6-mannosyltransferase n=1 Tax=Calycina marina TaxID=1763456 RepID=A0A9P7ZAZ3_9HELO|nr:putative initiation-specific alpha-1,6-mannosyltransferase [Calycina marina]